MVDPVVLRLDDFQARRGIQVHAQRIDWASAWDELLRTALYGQGPDISEIGSTWLGSLIGMDALRPLTSWHVNFLEDRVFSYPAARWAVIDPKDSQVWAVPLLTDTRVIYYRRDWLKQAGIEEAGAFKTQDSLVDTLERLQASGVEIPWAMPTRGLNVLYDAAPLVWNAGGRFRTKDGRHLRLHEPGAQAGMRAYFELHRFLSPPARDLDIVGTDEIFLQNKAAAVISGSWLLRLLERETTLLPGVGIVRVPGIPFIGGSHLVIWRHARHERAIMRLVKHLTSPEIQQSCFQHAGHLPSRIELLDDEPFVSDPRYQAFATSLKTGRVFTISFRWAAVERRLVDMFSQLWSDLADDPELDLEAEIAGRTALLIEDLERTLLAIW
jgi:multiple sugar transport system substrate-binding protein